MAIKWDDVRRRAGLDRSSFRRLRNHDATTDTSVGLEAAMQGTTEDQAALLLAAADKLDALVADATAGPWWSDDSDQCWRLHGVAIRMPASEFIPEQLVGKQILKAPKHGTPYAEYWPGAADGALIALMGNPQVAAALSAWLRATRRSMRLGWAADPPPEFEAALKVAQLIVAEHQDVEDESP